MLSTETPTATDPKEYKIPAALLGIGILIYLAYALCDAGPKGVTAMMIFLPIQIVVQVILGVIACFVTAKIMGASFGYVSSAVVKLAAIFVFPGAIGIFIPRIGWLVSLVLYWGMLEQLFELDVMETIVLAVVICIVSVLAVILVTAIGFAAG